MSVGSDLLRFSDRKIVLWDKESQRLNLMHDNLPFECAWVVVQRGKILSRHSYYLGWRPVADFCRRMSPDAARITRFQRAWVENGDDPEHVLEAFESYANNPDYLLAGHNVLGFDGGLWQLWREALGRPRDWTYQQRLIDTNLLARAWKEGWKPDRENLYSWQMKVAAGFRKGVKTSLGLMAKEFEIPVDESQQHRATYDLELNAAVLWKLINLMEV